VGQPSRAAASARNGRLAADGHTAGSRGPLLRVASLPWAPLPWAPLLRASLPRASMLRAAWLPWPRPAADRAAAFHWPVSSS
jgi:hypothetical protein